MNYVCGYLFLPLKDGCGTNKSLANINEFTVCIPVHWLSGKGAPLCDSTESPIIQFRQPPAIPEWDFDGHPEVSAYAGSTALADT